MKLNAIFQYKIKIILLLQLLKELPECKLKLQSSSWFLAAQIQIQTVWSVLAGSSVGASSGFALLCLAGETCREGGRESWLAEPIKCEEIEFARASEWVRVIRRLTQIYKSQEAFQ